MDGDVIECLLSIIVNKDLIKISKKMKLKIKGFRDIQEKNGVIMPPRNLVIKELLSSKNKDLLVKIFEKDSKDKIDVEIDKANILNNIDEAKKEKIISTLEKLINNNIKVMLDEKELDLENIEYIFSEIQFNERKSENEELVKNNYNIKIEMLNRTIEDLKNNNKNMIQNIKDLKKEKINLQKEIQKLKKENEYKNKESEKYKNDFFNIKKKYDEIKILKNMQDIELEERNSQIQNLKEINGEINIKLDLFEKKESERKKLEIRKVAVLGEMNSKDINNIKNYEINLISIKEIEKFKSEINTFNEIWLLSYTISYLEKITIQENIGQDRIKEFTSYIKLKSYLKGRV